MKKNTASMKMHIVTLILINSVFLEYVIFLLNEMIFWTFYFKKFISELYIKPKYFHTEGMDFYTLYSLDLYTRHPTILTLPSFLSIN